MSPNGLMHESGGKARARVANPSYYSDSEVDFSRPDIRRSTVYMSKFGRPHLTLPRCR